MVGGGVGPGIKGNAMTTVQESVKQENAKRVRAWLDEHWQGQHSCAICHSSRWVEDGMIGVVELMHHSGRRMGDSAYPLVVVTCETCGYSLLFNAAVIGLVQGGV